MRSRRTRLVCLRMVLLAAGFFGPPVLADPLYMITDLGTGPITVMAPNGRPTVMSPLASERDDLRDGGRADRASYRRFTELRRRRAPARSDRSDGVRSGIVSDPDLR